MSLKGTHLWKTDINESEGQVDDQSELFELRKWDLELENELHKWTKTKEIGVEDVLEGNVSSAKKISNTERGEDG